MIDSFLEYNLNNLKIKLNLDNSNNPIVYFQYFSPQKFLVCKLSLIPGPKC